MKTYEKDELILAGELGENFEPWLKQKREKNPIKYKKMKTALIKKTTKPGDLVREEPMLFSSGPSDASSVEYGDVSMDEMDKFPITRDFDDDDLDASEEDEPVITPRKDKPVKKVVKRARKYDLVLEEEDEDMDF
jgi:hypothetical protein